MEAHIRCPQTSGSDGDEDPVFSLMWRIVHDRTVMSSGDPIAFADCLYAEYELLDDYELYADAFIRLFACICLEINDIVDAARSRDSAEGLDQFK